MLETPTIQWGKAKVDTGTGALHLQTEHLDEHVAGALDGVLAERDGCPWGEVAAGEDGELVVTGITPGTEDDVRDALEAVLADAAAAAEPARVRAEAERQAQALASERGGPEDAKAMQKRFRSFG